ncbi:uncharacterized protein TRAVEDRAFT_53636 [Trametes versicolor FP-101664 SS1]|uniref:uncharacterized protein n=1 Tax=Trametes versicolor (strain FP-101664) TaxID=717944 RepID=UPI00046245DE|nr:uncharacterized protein TRAVEDRAFT_53636 [Trametes versicolor FP-101664 SS1]EIW52212.1 hypothetical protein TRAVEDRAFT_53636 [Trametes versicolor FP-101664 SS1]
MSSCLLSSAALPASWTSSSKRVSSSKAVPVEKKAGSHRPSKKTAAGKAHGPRAHRSGLPLFSPPVYPRAPAANGAVPDLPSTSVAPIGEMSGQDLGTHKRLQAVRAIYLSPLYRDFAKHFSLLLPQGFKPLQEPSDDTPADGPFVPSPSAEDPCPYWPITKASFLGYVDYEVECFRREFTHRFRQSLSDERVNPQSMLPGLSKDEAVAFRALLQTQILFKARAEVYGAMTAGATAGLAGFLQQLRSFLDQVIVRSDAGLAALTRDATADAASSAGPSTLREAPPPVPFVETALATNTESMARTFSA